MKIINLIVAIVIAGCAHTRANEHMAPVVVKAEHIAYIDNPQDDSAILEEKKYEDSLNRIERQMSDEYNQYKICLSVNKKDNSSCKKLLESFCEIDVMIDSRAKRHSKRYCSKMP